MTLSSAHDDDTTELADRAISFQAGLDGEPLDALRSEAWQKGWMEAQSDGGE